MNKRPIPDNAAHQHGHISEWLWSVSLILALLCSTRICDASQADFQASADVLKSRQQTIVKLFGAGGGSLDSYGEGRI